MKVFIYDVKIPTFKLQKPEIFTFFFFQNNYLNHFTPKKNIKSPTVMELTINYGHKLSVPLKTLSMHVLGI